MSTLKKESAPLKLRDIRIQKLLAERPEIFRPAQLPKVDLRELQTELLKKQTDERLGEGLKTRNKQYSRFRFRRANPVKQLPLIECRVIDTQKSFDGSRLYFELSNGQCVRADRFFPAALESRWRFNKKDVKRFYSKRRKNEILRDLIASEIAKNANREASK
jgi:hypothetical protein